MKIFWVNLTKSGRTTDTSTFSEKNSYGKLQFLSRVFHLSENLIFFELSLDFWSSISSFQLNLLYTKVAITLKLKTEFTWNCLCHFHRVRISHQRCSVNKGALKKVANFTGKNLCWSLFLIKLQAWELSCKICKKF